MTYAESLRQMFPTLDPVVRDLYLLEAHQIANLPERAPPAELATVLMLPGSTRAGIEP